jgi:ribosomal protein S18 acetylase RimI-like enzyme
MDLTIRELTPDDWPAVEDLFDTTGPVGRCWCMYWRIGSQYRKLPSDANKAAFRDVVDDGPPPGLLAYDGDLAVGWCQLTARDALPWLDSSWRLERVDDVAVWSISCFYVRKGHRRRGVVSALVAAALEAAHRAGAPAVEAYPLDASLSPSTSHTGYSSTFERAGFTTVARHTPARPIMRYEFSRG